jgi:hypothetical protein
MTLPQALLIAFTSAICALLLLITIRALGRRILNTAARRIEQMCAEAIAKPRPHHDIEAEYRQLVAAEQGRD